MKDLKKSLSPSLSPTLSPSLSPSLSSSSSSINIEDFNSEWEQDLVKQYLRKRRHQEEIFHHDGNLSFQNNQIKSIQQHHDDQKNQEENTSIGFLKKEKQKFYEEDANTNKSDDSGSDTYKQVSVVYKIPIKKKDGRFYCPYQNCERSFSEKYPAKLHINDIHRHLRLFPCSICNESFPNPRRRQRHVVVKHPPKDGFYCNYCERHFANRFSLADHIYTYHRDTSELKCEICGKNGFSRENQLEKHLLLKHTKRNDDGTFCCIYEGCSIICNSYPSFRVHLRVHKDLERQFICRRPNCDERFVTFYARDEHEKSVHGRWICQHCGKGYSIPFHFFRHVKSHSDISIVEKPQIGCPFKGCSKVFSSRNSMQRQHFYSSHFKLLQYRCGICSELFSVKVISKQHRKNMHPNSDGPPNDMVYHSKDVKNAHDLAKIFKAFEEGWLTYDMFKPDGGLDISRDDVNAMICKAIKEIEIPTKRRTRQELDREKNNSSKRMKTINRETIDDLLISIEDSTTTSNLFEDSIDVLEVPLENSLSTNTEIHLSLHKRPRRRSEGIRK